MPKTPSKPKKPVTTPAAPVIEWHHFDAKGRVLGRLATEISSLLLGKHLPSANRRSAAPVQVVVTNAAHVALTGRKETQKHYYRYSGYPGGMRSRSVAEQREREPEFIIREAVSGMLPKNKLRAVRLRQLKIYPGETHPHQAQISTN